MNLRDALRERRSIRRYLDRSVPEDLVSQLIDAAEDAPSAGNLRSRSYVVVTRPDLRAALAVAALGQEQVATARVLVVVCAEPARSSTRYGDRGYLYSIQDATAAVMCILLRAHDLGLGACWIGAFDDQSVRDVLHLEEELMPVAMISLGWPAEKPAPPPRRDQKEVARWE